MNFHVIREKPSVNRHSLIGALPLAEARAATDALFGMVRPEAFYDRPVPKCHRTIFYFDHLEAFDWNLVSQAPGVPSFHPEFDRLFACGIDPEPGRGQAFESDPMQVLVGHVSTSYRG